MSSRISLLSARSDLVSSPSTLIFTKSGFAPIHKAAAKNNHVRVKILLGTAINQEVLTRDKRKITPLLAAAMFGSTAAFQLLLNSGANFKARSADGLTAVQCAAAHCHSSIILALNSEHLLCGLQEIFEYLSSFPEMQELQNCLIVLEHALAARMCVGGVYSTPLQEKILQCSGLRVLADILDVCTRNKAMMNLIGTMVVQIIEKLSSCTLLAPEILTTSIPQSVLIAMQTNSETLVSALVILKKMTKEVFLELGAPSIIMNIAMTSQNEQERKVAIESMCSNEDMAQIYYEQGFLQNILQLLKRPSLSNKFLLVILNLLKVMSNVGGKVLMEFVEDGFMQVLLEHFMNQSTMVTIQVISLLRTFCLDSDKACSVIKESKQSLQKLIYLSRFHLSLDSKFESFEIVWLLAGNSDKERTGLAYVLGPACIKRVLSLGNNHFQYMAVTMLRLISPDMYGLQDEITGTRDVVLILQLIRLADSYVQLEALKVLENLSYDIAMRTNKNTQKSVLKMDAIQLLLRLYSTTKDERLKLQACCTLAAVSIGNPAMKKSIIHDSKFSLKALIEVINKPQPDQTVLCTAMRALCYYAYNSIKTQSTICEAKKVSVEPFRNLMFSRDKVVSSLAAFQLIVLVRVLETKEDKTQIVADSLRLLINELELAVGQENISLQVHICSLLSASLHIRVGLPNAALAYGVASILTRLLLSDIEQCRRTSAITLSYLTLTPRGSRTILGYCRKSPRLFHLLKRHSEGYVLSESFLEGWEHYRTTHLLRAERGWAVQEEELVAAPLAEAKVFGE